MVVDEAGIGHNLASEEQTLAAESGENDSHLLHYCSPP